MIDVNAVWATMDDEPAPSTGGHLRRRLPINAYEVYLTQERPSRLPGLHVSTSEKPGSLWKELRDSTGLEVRFDARPGHPASLHLAERDSRYHEVFSDMVSRLVAAIEELSAMEAQDRPLLMDHLAARILRWQAALRANQDGLSSERRAGLFGELCLLLHVLDAGVTPTVAVAKWTGPADAIQDFQYVGLAMEVKTSRQTQPTNVRIASERQLDTSTHDRLLLIHYGLDERSDGSGTSLNQIVERVRSTLGPAGHAAITFEDHLAAYGYFDLHGPRYADTSYAIRNVDYFDVRDPMPRIAESDVPIGLGRVSYDLSLAVCEPCRLSEAEVSDLLVMIAS